MKRRHRLQEKERFRQVRQNGARFAGPIFALHLLPNEQPVSRCGFTVSRRIGKAVERNRARRRMSEAMRLLWDLVEPGWDVVLVARPAINTTDFAALQSACVALLRRAGILRTQPVQAAKSVVERPFKTASASADVPGYGGGMDPAEIPCIVPAQPSGEA